jgi:hypothetical protein
MNAAITIFGVECDNILMQCVNVCMYTVKLYSLLCYLLNVCYKRCFILL